MRGVEASRLLGLDTLCVGAVAKVKLSSTEPEIGAGSYAGKRSSYLRGFIGEVIELPRVPIQHIVDNSATRR